MRTKTRFVVDKTLKVKEIQVPEDENEGIQVGDEYFARHTWFTSYAGAALKMFELKDEAEGHDNS
ncbi:MAG: hypothetical protein AAGF57_08460 [Pseudomonadota bacterium]